jgi:hypothetical protein
VRVVTQAFASVTVTVYVPALSPVAIAPVPPAGAHEYVYPPAPPLATTVADPFAPPEQETFVCEPVVPMADGCVMLNVPVDEHAFASVTVTVHVPAVSPVTLFVPSPAGLPGVQSSVSVPVPPLAVTLAEPLLPPLHETFVWPTGVTTIAGGAVRLKVAVPVQAFASVTVTVHVPAVSPVTLFVPSPVGLPGVQL